MRNKSAFTKPVVQQSFKKSSRSYPQPKGLFKNSNLMVKQVIKVRGEPQTQHNNGFHAIPRNSKGQLSEKYHMHLQNVYPVKIRGQNVYTDPYCIWFRQIQNSLYKQTNRLIKINSAQYVVSNWTEDEFPSAINICIEDFYGYLDSNGMPTDRVAILEIQKVDAENELNSLKSYEIRYKMKKQIVWEIPKQKTFLKFYLTLDNQNQKIQLPIVNPIVLSLQMSFK